MLPNYSDNKSIDSHGNVVASSASYFNNTMPTQAYGERNNTEGYYNDGGAGGSMMNV